MKGFLQSVGTRVIFFRIEYEARKLKGLQLVKKPIP